MSLRAPKLHPLYQRAGFGRLEGHCVPVMNFQIEVVVLANLRETPPHLDTPARFRVAYQDQTGVLCYQKLFEGKFLLFWCKHFAIDRYGAVKLLGSAAGGKTGSYFCDIVRD